MSHIYRMLGTLLCCALLVTPEIAQPVIAGCPLLPADNIWNTPIDTLPVELRSADYLASIGLDDYVHPDFGSGTWDGGPIGIPYITVPGTQPKVVVSFDYDDESDAGLYPIPTNAPIEGGPNSDGDRHVLVVDRDNCILYELYDAWPQADGSWLAGSGAIYDLRDNALRPDGWTSADAAGLPILPGLVRYDEVLAGEIAHAIRVTAPRTRDEHIWPARHDASYDGDMRYPPMGQRFRLRADFDMTGFAPTVQVILQAMKTYGLILADNGSPWFISGVPDARWDNDELRQLRQVHGSDFVAVDVSSLMVDPDSGQVRGDAPTATVTAKSTATSTASPSRTRTATASAPATTTGTMTRTRTASATRTASSTWTPTATPSPWACWLPLILRD